MCGGTSHRLQSTLPNLGLSPRVRGNPYISILLNSSSGSIPACAGEPAKDVEPVSLYEVYPRVCGGTGVAASASGPAMGLSPRVRGNHSYRQWC